MVTIFKNLTNILVLFGDWYFFNQPSSPAIMLSLLLMLAGAVMAGFADIAFSALGYSWMAFNCLSTAAYGTCVRACVHVCVCLLTVKWSFEAQWCQPVSWLWRRFAPTTRMLRAVDHGCVVCVLHVPCLQFCT